MEKISVEASAIHGINVMKSRQKKGTRIVIAAVTKSGYLCTLVKDKPNRDINNQCISLVHDSCCLQNLGNGCEGE